MHGQTAGGLAVSLSTHEQQALDLIKNGLTSSDTELAALMGTFNRLTAAEEMPAREKIRPGSPEAAGCAGRGRRHPHRKCRYPSQRNQRPVRPWAAPALWLAITLSMITVALVLSRTGSPANCATALAMVCSKSASAHSMTSVLGHHS
jgi:hypothetical protein